MFQSIISSFGQKSGLLQRSLKRKLSLVKAMLSHKVPTGGFGEGSVFLQPLCLDEEEDAVKRPIGQKARRFKPLIKAKLARLYFIPKQVTDGTPSGQRRRKTGTKILSQLTCKSCRRVFHKRTGLRLHSCKKPSTKQHKPSETKTGKNMRNMQALSISSICPRIGCDFPPKRVEVKLRRIRNRHPARPSSSFPNDSHSVSGQQVCLKRMEVKLHRCELPTGFNSPRCFSFFHHSSHSPSTKLPFSSTSLSWQSKKPMKRKHQMAMVSYPAKTPCIEDMQKTKTGDDEDEEVVILWQG